MKNKTAVEWLEQEFIALQNYGVNELGLFEKAKEMEKQNMIKFANDFLFHDDTDLTAEQYSKEIYGK